MENDFIQLPNVTEIEEDLNLAKEDIDAALEADSSLEPFSTFINEVIGIIKSKITGLGETSELDFKTKVDLAAHMTLLNSLMDEIFASDMEEWDLEEGEEEQQLN